MAVTSTALVLLMAPLAACAPRPQGPTWPKRADRDLDGGESIAPHQARSVAAVTPDADEEAKPAAAAVKDAPAATEAAKPAVAPIDPAASDDTLFIDDITIEIED